MEKSEAIGLYDSLLSAADTARRSGLYEVMFHALAGALHSAEALENLDRVREVEQRAADVHDWLARHHPEHRIGTESAHRRGQTDVFTTLGVHAQSIASRIRAAHAVDRARDKTRVHDADRESKPRRDTGSISEGDAPASYVSE